MDRLGEQLGAIVRPLIAMVFAIIACVAFLVGQLNADQWLGLATMVIAFYFAAKTAENAQRRAPNRSTDINISNNEGDVNVPGNELPPDTRTTRQGRSRQ